MASFDEINTITYFIAQRYPEMRQHFPDPHEFGAVHRLDRNTSGVMLIAKDPETLGALQAQMQPEILGEIRRFPRAEKRYWSLVHGVPEPREGSITSPIVYIPGKSRHVMSVDYARAHGVPSRYVFDARTDYRVAEAYENAGQRYALLEIDLHTGRTHQVRFHMRGLGHMLVGERFYVTRPRPPIPSELKRLFFFGQALHARSMDIIDPQSGALVRLEAEPPTDFSHALDLLRGQKSLGTVSIPQPQNPRGLSQRVRFAHMQRSMRGIEHRLLGTNPLDPTPPADDLFHLGQYLPVLWNFTMKSPELAHAMEHVRRTDMLDRLVSFTGKRVGLTRLRAQLFRAARYEIHVIDSSYIAPTEALATRTPSEGDHLYQRLNTWLNAVSDIPFGPTRIGNPVTAELLEQASPLRAEIEDFLMRNSYAGHMPRDFAAAIDPNFSLLTMRGLQWHQAERDLLKNYNRETVQRGDTPYDFDVGFFGKRERHLGLRSRSYVARILSSRLMHASILDYQARLLLETKAPSERVSENIRLLVETSERLIARVLGGIIKSPGD